MYSLAEVADGGIERFDNGFNNSRQRVVQDEWFLKADKV